MSDDAYNPKNGQNTFRYKIKCHLWGMVNATLFRWSPFFCHRWRRVLLRFFGAKMANTATVARTAVIDAPWCLNMGERAMIAAHAVVSCFAPVVIGDNAIIGEYAKVLTGSHVSNSKNFKPVASRIEIGKNCWIATSAMLVSGGYRKLTIGDGAIISAGAVVMRSVKSMAIMIGNPAKYLMDRELVKD